jgi:hypothetical protein
MKKTVTKTLGYWIYKKSKYLACVKDTKYKYLILDLQYLIFSFIKDENVFYLGFFWQNSRSHEQLIQRRRQWKPQANLNVYQLERQGEDIQDKMEGLRLLNQSLWKRDKSKDDSIAILADQLVTLTEKLKLLEQREQIKQFQYLDVW